jgi:nucleotide-binding universal stress UspA family protein
VVVVGFQRRDAVFAVTRRVGVAVSGRPAGQVAPVLAVADWRLVVGLYFLAVCWRSRGVRVRLRGVGVRPLAVSRRVVAVGLGGVGRCGRVLSPADVTVAGVRLVVVTVVEDAGTQRFLDGGFDLRVRVERVVVDPVDGFVVPWIRPGPVGRGRVAVAVGRTRFEFVLTCLVRRFACVHARIWGSGGEKGLAVAGGFFAGGCKQPRMQVLLGVGGSSLSYRALEETIDRAAEAGDDVTVAVFVNEEVDATQEEVEQRVRETLAEKSFSAEVRHIDGSPGSALVEIANGEAYDRIVLGSGQRSPLGKIQLGSVAEFVLLNAQTPVTLVR